MNNPMKKAEFKKADSEIFEKFDEIQKILEKLTDKDIQYVLGMKLIHASALCSTEFAGDALELVSNSLETLKEFFILKQLETIVPEIRIIEKMMKSQFENKDFNPSMN